jgi:hypothetical protein
MGSRGAPLFPLSILSSMLFDALPQAEEEVLLENG